MKIFAGYQDVMEEIKIYFASHGHRFERCRSKLEHIKNSKPVVILYKKGLELHPI